MALILANTYAPIRHTHVIITSISHMKPYIYIFYRFSIDKFGYFVFIIFYKLKFIL